MYRNNASIPEWVHKLASLKQWAALAVHDISPPRRGHPVTVDQRLVLVSQIQRSGGTLLSQLFDGHPECHAHPNEIMIGKPKWIWPNINAQSARPSQVCRQLYEVPTNRHILWGFTKPGRGSMDNPDFHPFEFSRSDYRRLFAEAWNTSPPKTQRDILNCYFTAYFNAWTDNQNLYGPDKKIISGFTPRLNLDADSIARVFRDYPDGTLIQVIRDPVSWYASASRHGDTYQNPTDAMELWKKSARSMLNYKERYGDQVVVITFSDLVGNTRETMEMLADKVGITWHDCLAIPSFNTIPTRADSSFKVAKTGIVADVLKRKDQLDPDVRNDIEQSDEIMGLYDALCDEAATSS